MVDGVDRERRGDEGSSRAEGTGRVSTSATQRSALLVATLASFLTPFMGSSLNVALPSIDNEFGMDAITLSWVPTSYLLAASMFLVPFGRLADIYGRKRIFSYGVVSYTTASVLCAFASSGTMLIAGRALQGLGGAMMLGIGVAILTSVFPSDQRGKVLGINTASVYIGLSVGPFIGGYLTQQLGWRSIFLANIPLGILMIILVSWHLKGEWAEAKGAKIDITGSIVYSLALTAIMYGFSLLPSASGAVLISSGVLGMVLFVRLQDQAESPMMDTKLFRRNRAFAFSNLAALINYSATFAVGFLLSLYLQYVRGFSPQNAGFILVAQPVVMALGSPYAGRLSDRVEPRVVASWGMGLIVIGLLLFAFLSETTPIAVIVGGLILLGLGFALFSSPNTNAVMSSVDRSLYGVAAGTLATMRMTGQMLSIGIAMLIFALMVGRVQITAENASRFLISVNIAFAIFALLCIGGVFASLARGRVR
jgi:EmrB/QacA subfamily drug resistance transporter